MKKQREIEVILFQSGKSELPCIAKVPPVLSRCNFSFPAAGFNEAAIYFEKSLYSHNYNLLYINRDDRQKNSVCSFLAVTSIH
ncbi:MAG: hypothetical protein IT223_04620 [Crocinitomicaceae bacterium]|nr:hypothetical protein [Crocinitomicaceae bacterium]